MENVGQATIISRDFGLSDSTVSTIFKIRKKFKLPLNFQHYKCNKTFGVEILSLKRMEKLLLV